MKRCIEVLSVAALTLALGTTAGALTYEVHVENQIPGGPDTGQPFSPPVLVVHGSGYSMFGPGEFATPGLALVAEEGDPSLLQAEAEADPDVYSVVVGTGPFFDSQVLTIEGNPGECLSAVWMLGRTNDLISGAHDVILPESGMLEFITNVYDAGTEVNTGLIEHIPFYGFSGVGPDENEPISLVTEYAVVNDPDHGMLEWVFPPAGRLVIRVVQPTPTADTSWGAIKALFR